MKNNSDSQVVLTIIGSGIKAVSHITIEAKAHIEQAKKVLYLINEPVMKQWLHELNLNSESLDFLYNKCSFRKENYHLISDYILENLHIHENVCFVLYGHPTVFAQPAIDAAKKAKKAGYQAKILPGISALDCLFADLLINPGDSGCQLIEATDLLVNSRQIDPSSDLIIWQVGVVGIIEYVENQDNFHALHMLTNYLIKFYNHNHSVILYEAAQYPSLEPTMISFPISELAKQQISRISTLYIPPGKIKTINKEVLQELKIDISNI